MSLLKTRLALALWAGAMGAALIVPAAAQFGNIFGPPRPPSDIPNAPSPSDSNIRDSPVRPPPPPQDFSRPAFPQNFPQNLPQRDSREFPPDGDFRAGSPPPGVQSSPLPPPPGSPASPAGPDADTQQALPSPTPGLPPGQRQPRGTAQPANTAPQPGDEVVVNPPTQKIANPIAVFSGLDKITGRIISFDVNIGETVQFGALQVVPRACYTRPPTEAQSTDAFAEVSEVTLQGEVRRIFTGWMFASSPGLHAVEHPIYDIWLKDCKGAAKVVEAAPEAEAKPAAETPALPRRAPPTPRPAPQRQPALPPPPRF
jgi:hypothetical protein